MIQFIYFDVGGVAVIDFSGNNKWSELRAELGVTAQNTAAFETVWKANNAGVCIDVDIEAYVPILQKELGLQLPLGYSLLDGFVKRFEANPDVWPAIDYARARAKVGLLTNMYVGMFASLEQRNILPPGKWDAVIDSSVEKCQKPNPRIFEVAQAKAGVPGSNILFIDNSPEHLEAATRFGWQTFLYDTAHPAIASADLLHFLQQNA